MRTEYIPAERDERGNLKRGTGRGKQTVIGSIPSWTESLDFVPDDIKVALEPEELTQLKEWLEQKKKESTEEHQRFSLKGLSFNLEQASKWLENNPTDPRIDHKEAQAIYDMWSRLQTALRVAGFKRGKD
jgi:hypothetical protein